VAGRERGLAEQAEGRMVAAADQHVLRLDLEPRADARVVDVGAVQVVDRVAAPEEADAEDRKSTRLNSSHGSISYAVVGLKKKRASGTIRPNVESPWSTRAVGLHPNLTTHPALEIILGEAQHGGPLPALSRRQRGPAPYGV